MRDLRHDALLHKVGLSDKRNAFAAQLSGGQKQCVGIVRALAVRPDLLLFDEPTSALDPELVGEVIVVMRELARDGMTMVIVTDKMGFRPRRCDRTVFIDRGQVVVTGAPLSCSPRRQPFARASSFRATRRHRSQLGGCRDRAKPRSWRNRSR